MDKARTLSLTNEFSSIKEHAASIKDGISWVDHGLVKISGGSLSLRSRYLEILRDYLSQAKTLVGRFNSAIGQLSEENLDIGQVSPSMPARAYLREIMISCDTILGYLGVHSINLSVEENEKLVSLIAEARIICEGLDRNFLKSVELAGEAIENGHFLGGAMILSRLVNNALSQIGPESASKKINELIGNGLLNGDPEKMKKGIAEAGTEAASYISTSIDTFPGSSEAISFLGNCNITLSIMAAYLKSANE